ncbi:gamma-glutamylcyclotransferase family protein [Kaarinaea lacus]
MKNLFVYGTLMFDEVWQQLVSSHYHKIDAELADYIRLKVINEDYPGIIPSAGTRIPGKLILDVSNEDIKQLDLFEGEYYRRDSVIVFSGSTSHPAETYVFKERFQSLLSNEEWEVDAFKNSGLPSFLSRYGYFNQ